MMVVMKKSQHNVSLNLSQHNRNRQRRHDRP
jgi:hypothetical protein